MQIWVIGAMGHFSIVFASLCGQNEMRQQAVFGSVCLEFDTWFMSNAFELPGVFSCLIKLSFVTVPHVRRLLLYSHLLCDWQQNWSPIQPIFTYRLNRFRHFGPQFPFSLGQKPGVILAMNNNPNGLASRGDRTSPASLLPGTLWQPSSNATTT